MFIFNIEIRYIFDHWEAITHINHQPGSMAFPAGGVQVLCGCGETPEDAVTELIQYYKKLIVPVYVEQK